MKVQGPRPGAVDEMRLIPKSKTDSEFLAAMMTCLRNEQARMLLVTFTILTAGSVEKLASDAKEKGEATHGA